MVVVLALKFMAMSLIISHLEILSRHIKALQNAMNSNYKPHIYQSSYVAGG